MDLYEKNFIFHGEDFSRICLSILLEKGFCAESLIQGELELHGRASFLITSYPCGESILSKLKAITVPVIILADHVGKELVKHTRRTGEFLLHGQVHRVTTADIPCR
jgi:hypothetical protein